MKTIPAGMIEVSQEQFFQALKADARDIMPSTNSPDFTSWETRDRQRWGWTLPGWKNPSAEKVYAVFPNSIKAVQS